MPPATSLDERLEEVLCDRPEIPFIEFAERVLKTTPNAARKQRARGTLAVAVIQTKPSKPGARGGRLMVPACEVRRFLVARLAGERL